MSPLTQSSSFRGQDVNLVNKVFIGAVLRKNGCWMGMLLSEEGGDGGFSFIVWKGRIVICSKVHAILSDLPFYRSDAKLGPARKFAVVSVSNAPGSAAAAVDRRPAVIAALRAMIQYF